jgi:dihydrofolate synthase/folylpolyglutamate synthase
LVAVITAIDYDHMNILGKTLREIAAVKCGILKPNSVAVSYPLQHEEAMTVISDRAREEGIPLLVPDLSALSDVRPTLRGTHFTYRGLSLFVPLTGEHQVTNALTALTALFALRERGFALPDTAIAGGFSRVHILARQEVLCESPLVLLDGSHNPQGLRALADTLRRFVPQRPLVLVMGILADKDYEAAIAAVAPLCDSFVAVRPPNPRALAPAETARVASRYVSDVTSCEDPREAVRLALAKCGKTGALVICGSLYQAAVLRNAVREFIG